MRKLIKGLLWTAAIIAIIVGLARFTIIRWWRVPTNDPVLEASVSPTLRAGDLVILWRATKPDIGDLAVCPEPGHPERVVIGRVAGLGNDEVRIEHGLLILNDDAAETERGCTPGSFTVVDPVSGSEVEQTCWVESFAGTSHPRGNLMSKRVRGALKVKHTVGPGNAFLLSDNRQFHYDSRDFGTVEYATCKEQVVFRIWGTDGFFGEDRFEFIP